MFLRIDENFSSSERRIFRHFSLREFFNFKGQNIWHFENFPRLEMLPTLTGIQFLNKRFGRMTTLRHEFQQGRVRQPFSSCLLGVTTWYFPHEFEVFFF